jgi:hypothetical protein
MQGGKAILCQQSFESLKESSDLQAALSLSLHNCSTNNSTFNTTKTSTAILTTAGKKKRNSQNSQRETTPKAKPHIHSRYKHIKKTKDRTKQRAQIHKLSLMQKI